MSFPIPDRDYGRFEAADVELQARREHAERDGSRPRRGGRGPRPPRRGRRGLRLLVVALAALVLLGIVGGIYVSYYFSNGKPGKAVEVTIPHGSTLGEIAQILAGAGVVKRAGAFKIRVETDGHGGDLESAPITCASTSPTTCSSQRLIAGPPVVTVKVTIPEGYTARQTAAAARREDPRLQREATTSTSR